MKTLDELARDCRLVFTPETHPMLIQEARNDEILNPDQKTPKDAQCGVQDRGNDE